MRSAALLALCLLLTGGLPSVYAEEVPQLVVEQTGGESKPLALESLSISIRIDGALAETVYDLTFRNDEARQREGEFRMKLPPGAIVSTYALEVGDDLREGVAVEKEKARSAYESIKARRVDPGIVELGADNVHRTRIFPIPRNGTKRVRIGYLETLPLVDGLHRYQLGLGLRALLPPEIQCSLEVPDGEVRQITATQDLKMTAPKDSVRDISWTDELQVMTASAEKPVLTVEADSAGDAWFTLQGPGPVIPREPRPKPERLAVVIDASASRQGGDAAKEWAILGRVLQQYEASEVQVYLLRTELEPLTSLTGGARDLTDLTDLAAHWAAIAFDGAADFSRLGELDENLVLLFTDGQLEGELFAPPGIPAAPLVVVGRGRTGMNRSLVQAAHASGGVALDLRQPEEELVEGIVSRPSPLPVRMVDPPPGVKTEAFTPEEGRFLLHGKLGQHRPDSLRFQVGEQDLDMLYTVKIREGRPLSRSAMARAALERLREEGARDEAIIKLAKEQTLVTELTSIIVLEQWADHVRYEIPPPESALLKAYEEAIQKKAAEVSVPAGPDLTEWKEKRQWYARKFPWYDFALWSRQEQVGTWLQATEKMFDPGELDGAVVSEIRDWHNECRDLFIEEAKVETQPGFDEWREDLTRIGARLKAVSELKAEPGSGGRITVTVRGLVKKPGKISGTDRLPLHWAIKQAGGPVGSGSWSKVYLYRNGDRIGYNLMSREYRGVDLRPGDMVVVEPETFYWNEPFARDTRPDDPFGGPTPLALGGVDLSTGPAVFEKGAPSKMTVVPLPRDFMSNGVNPNRSPLELTSPPEAPAVDEAVELVPPDEPGPFPPLSPDEAVARLAASEDGMLRETYGYLRLSGQLDEDETLVEVARHFHEQGDGAMAYRILSNLAEKASNLDAGLRGVAYWLLDFGDTPAALQLLQRLAEADPSDPVRQYDCASAMHFSGNPGGAVGFFEKTVRASANSGSRSLVSLAMTDLGMEAEALDKEWLATEMESSLRVLVLASGGQHRLAMKEPFSFVQSAMEGGSVSEFGGRASPFGSVLEYEVRRAMPGSYAVTCRFPHSALPVEPITVRALFVERRPGEPDRVTVHTGLMKDGKIEFPAIEFLLPEPEENLEDEPGLEPEPSPASDPEVENDEPAEGDER